MKGTACTALSVFVLALSGLSSCARAKVTAHTPTTPAPAAEFAPTPETGPYIVIGHLEHRDRVVTIKTGELGTVYSAQNKDGTILFENLTAEQLKVKSPEIHGFIEASEAGSAALILPERSLLSIPGFRR